MATVDDHMCLTGWEMMEMEMKQNTMIEDKEPRPLCLHNCTCAQGEGGDTFSLMGDVLAVSFHSSITKMQSKMLKVDPMRSTGSNLIRVLLDRGVELILYIRIFYLELLEFLTIQLNPNTSTHPNLLSYCRAKHRDLP